VIILQQRTSIIISVLHLQLVNTETELQNSQETADEADYVAETQMVAPSDTTFPQGNL
jgi:hypothetical protein